MEAGEALVEKAVTRVARESSDFQTIRLGDLKLSAGVGARRIYHAEIRGDPATVTVAMYQGGGAKEEWRQHVAKYKLIRHPNVMQLYGLVSTKELHAMVFHDELIPYHQFFGRFKYSPILSAYIIGYCTTEFNEAGRYISDVFQKTVSSNDLDAWIRPSTGKLCLDLVQGA
ncbi:hypothetical protein MSAN_02379700 [Mycena sanguinolenta]|uniref:Protein kinase domain-containing protein n=1 Tax=Mycena sanguinolenta TaxID=230812 RepID=A0A8H7CG86_9AGAR|nr:hypothetical protein MSAN_02379700 [Mycena sanguinolenta]